MSKVPQSLRVSIAFVPQVHILSAFNLPKSAMDRDFWAHACNAATSRPLSALKQASYRAHAVAVSRSAARHTVAKSNVFLFSDFYLRFWCRAQRGILFAGLPTAALEAERERGGW